MKKSILFIVIGIIIGGLTAYGIVRHVAVQRAEAEIARLVDRTPVLEEIRYGKIQVGLIRSTFGMQDIQLRLTGFKEPIHIDRIDLDISEPGHQIPPRAKAEIKGIHLSTRHGLFKPVRTDLEAMGYQDIAGLITLAYHYDAAGKRLNLNDVTIRADQMGSVRFDLALTDLDLSRLVKKSSKPDIATLLTTVPMIGVAGGRLIYSDDSFLQRLLHRSAEQSGQKPSVYRLKSKEKLNQLLETEKNERVRQILSTLKDFIDHPKSVTISLNPSKPVPIFQFLLMKEPVDFLELLKVHVTI